MESKIQYFWWEFWAGTAVFIPGKYSASKSLCNSCNWPLWFKVLHDLVNYKRFGFTKIIPRISEAKLATVVKKSASAANTIPLWDKVNNHGWSGHSSLSCCCQHAEHPVNMTLKFAMYMKHIWFPGSVHKNRPVTLPFSWPLSTRLNRSFMT
jgi:hypothetical protein